MTQSTNVTLIPTRKWQRGYTDKQLNRRRKMNRLSAKHRTAAA